MSSNRNNGSTTPRLINEPNVLVEGFHRLAEPLLESRAPRLSILPEFWIREPKAQIEYLIKLASTMNHAARLIQNERDELVRLMVIKEAQLEQQAAQMNANTEMLQSEVTRMNGQRQGYHREVRRLNERVRELERGADG